MSRLWLTVSLLGCAQSARPAVNCPTVPAAGQPTVVCPDGATLDGARGVCVRTRVEEKVACPVGSTWSGTECSAPISTSCPTGMHFEELRGCVPNLEMATLPAAEPHGRAASFGTEGVRYSWGNGTLLQSDDGYVHLWNGGGANPVAIELVGASNGWWRYAGAQGDEYEVWSDGSATTQSMDGRPWLDSSSARPDAAPVVGSMTFGSKEYRWLLAVDHDVLRITTSDGNPIKLRARSSEVTFDGQTPRPTPSGARASGSSGGFGAVGAHYRVGKWTIARVADGNVYLWFGDTGTPPAAVEFIAESNGWWRYRDAKQVAWVVWSAGGYDKEFFYNEPWKSGVTAQRAPETATLDFGKDRYDWSLKVDHGRIEIVTSGGDPIVIDANKPTVTFKGSVVNPK